MTSRKRKSESSDERSPSADSKKLVEEWVWKHFGRRGIAALSTILVLGAIWWQWDQIVKLPDIVEVVELASRETLLRTDPQRFSIAVAYLEGHANSELEQNALLRFAATEQGSGEPNLQILHFERTIELKGGDQEIEASKGHDGPSPSADWKELLGKWVFKHWGRNGIVILAFILVAGTIWLKWKEIKDVPGIARIVNFVSRRRLPRADPLRFSLAVAIWRKIPILI